MASTTKAASKDAASESARAARARPAEPEQGLLSRIGWGFLALLSHVAATLFWHIWSVTTLLGCFCCRRCKRREALEKLRPQRYKELLSTGRKVAGARKEWYEKLAFWSNACTKTGARIFVLAPRGPKGQVDTWIYMWELLCFGVTLMHEVVVTEDRKFAIVWCMQNDHRAWSCSLMDFRDYLHPTFAKNLEAIHVIHPSWGVRITRILLWPYAEEALWERWTSHERIEFLEDYVDMQAFRLPKDLYEYDKFLDQQAAEFNDKQRMGGSNIFGASGTPQGGAGDEERKKAEAQMEQLKRLLEEKGYGEAMKKQGFDMKDMPMPAKSGKEGATRRKPQQAESAPAPETLD